MHFLTRSKVAQIFHFLSEFLMYDLGEELSVSKLGYARHPGIVGVLDRFAAEIDHFEVDERLLGVAENSGMRKVGG